MIYICCRTNLDLDMERWPDQLPAIPQIGQSIESSTDHKGFRLRLEVVAVTWKCRGENSRGGDWYPEVELHIPRAHHWSIVDFYNWYAPKVGRTPGAFI